MILIMGIHLPTQVFQPETTIQYNIIRLYRTIEPHQRLVQKKKVDQTIIEDLEQALFAYFSVHLRYDFNVKNTFYEILLICKTNLK